MRLKENLYINMGHFYLNVTAKCLWNMSHWMQRGHFNLIKVQGVVKFPLFPRQNYLNIL